MEWIRKEDGIFIVLWWGKVIGKQRVLESYEKDLKRATWNEGSRGISDPRLLRKHVLKEEIINPKLGEKVALSFEGIINNNWQYPWPVE